MRKKIAFLLGMLFVASLWLTACSPASPATSLPDETPDPEKPAESSEPDSQDPSAQDGPKSGYCVVETMADLRAMTVTEKDVAVSLLGYYEPGDGGQGIFFWNDGKTGPDDGGTLIKCRNETGRFSRLCEEQERNVKWFGAKGDGKTDDTAAIQAAIDSLNAHGGTVSIPTGKYLVSKPIEIGNGNAADKWSDKHGVALVGKGSGQGAPSSAASTSIMASAPMDQVISVNGLISGVSIRGMHVNGNMKAENGVFLHAFCGLTMEDVRITWFKQKGLYILGGGEPTGNYNIYNRFSRVYVSSPEHGAECLYMDGAYDASNDTWLSTFTQCAFDTEDGAGSAAAHFKFVDSISFYSCRFTAGPDSTGILFDALDNNDFPCGIGFYACSVSSTDVLEDNDHRIRKQFFYGFSTANGEKIPEHDRLIGITDTGATFHLDEVKPGTPDPGQTDQPPVSSLPGKKGIVDLFNAGEWVHYNLAQEKSAVGVHINCNGSLVGGKAYLPSYDNSIGTVHVKVYRWDTDYASSVSGKVLSSYDFVNFEENQWLSFNLSKALDAGDYLVVFTAETEAGDFGCGVWTQTRGSGIETFYNGTKANFGVAASLEIK